MRLALRILSILLIILVTVTTVLLFAGGGVSDSDPRFLISILTQLLGAITALATFIVGLIATATRRQFGWLIGLIAAAAFAVVFPVVANALAVNFVYANLVCTSPATCRPTGSGAILVYVAQVTTFISPAVVGLVALIYSFRVRAQPAPAAAPGL